MVTANTFAASFRSEVSRLARKEVRVALRPALEDLSKAKRMVQKQKREIAELERSVKRLTKLVKDQADALDPRGAAVVDDELGEKWRKDSVRSTRRKLKLTQGELATLLNVSTGSVNGWETGRTEPREARKQEVLALRQLTPTEARERLDAAGGARRKRKSRRRAKNAAAG